MLCLTLNITWTTGRNICYQTLSLHPWGFWESLARLKKDQCVCDECECIAAFCCVWEKQAKYCRNENTIAFNTFQILNRERKQERFKYFIFQGVLRALGKYELCSVCCVLCADRIGVCNSLWNVRLRARLLNTRTASQAAFFSLNILRSVYKISKYESANVMHLVKEACSSSTLPVSQLHYT